MGANIQPDFEWKETSPGRWERDIDEAEQFYASLAKNYEGSGRTFFAMTGFISLSIDIPEDTTRPIIEERLIEALRRAWLALRYDHPTIASWVEYDRLQKKCKKVYVTFPASALESQQRHWLERTFCIISDGRTGHEWCNSDPPVPHQPTLFLLTPPSSEDKGRVLRRDLILRAHHDIIDGIGTLHLLNNLLAHAARVYAQSPSSYQPPSFGTEWQNLSPPLHRAANIPPSPTPEQTTRLAHDTVQNNALKQPDDDTVELLTVPFKRGTQLPGKHQRVARTLRADRSSLRLLAACRARGVTVTHAYHAAIAMCVRDLQERVNPAGPRRVRYVNYCLVDLRKRCQSPFDSARHAAAVYHCTSGRGLAVDLDVSGAAASIAGQITAQSVDGVKMDGIEVADSDAAQSSSMRRREEFDRVVREMRDFYLSVRDDPDLLGMAPLYWSLGTLPYPEDGATPPVPLPNESPSVSISSMGVIDKIISPTHGPFELSDPWVTGEELGTGLGLFLGTWRGQLSLSAAYNDAWHEKEDVLKFLQDCEDTVFHGLGI